MLLNCEEDKSGPLTTDHAPVPTEGVFPESVRVAELQMVCVEPLLAVVGGLFTVMVADAAVMELVRTQVFASVMEVKV